MWVVPSAIVGAVVYGATALATPGTGFTGTSLAVGRFGDIDVNNFTVPAADGRRD